MRKKLFKYIKFLVSMVLILGLVAPSYASLSASDGSAFVTKAEFDSALADFNSRLTTFEAGINSKIDSQVTSYLDRNGIWNGKNQVFETDVVVDKFTGNNLLAQLQLQSVDDFLKDFGTKNKLMIADVSKSGLMYVVVKTEALFYESICTSTSTSIWDDDGGGQLVLCFLQEDDNELTSLQVGILGSHAFAITAGVLTGYHYHSINMSKSVYTGLFFVSTGLPLKVGLRMRATWGFEAPQVATFPNAATPYLPSGRAIVLDQAVVY